MTRMTRPAAAFLQMLGAVLALCGLAFMFDGQVAAGLIAALPGAGLLYWGGIGARRNLNPTE